MLTLINDLVWGKPLLILLLGTGLIYTLLLKFFQIRKFPFIMKKTFFSLFKDKTALKSRDCDSISQFQAVSAALAAAMGTGNIAGVATAITLGGPGAIFWMWVSAIAGMALVYGENYLGTVYRRKKHGRWYGGPMAYLENGAGSKRLACLFAVFCAFAALGMGNMTQVNSISSALDGCFGIPPLATGIAAAVIAGIIISGGIKRIGSASQALIPFLSIVYIAVSAYAIICNIENVPGAFSLIFKEAFGIREVGGGISGAVISKSVNAGLRRGVFSNEAGLGSSAVLHSSADCNNPGQQGMWAVFEVFADTIVCCTVTALVILTTGAADSGKDGVLLVTEAFGRIAGIGRLSPYFIAAAVAMFAFATIIGWFYCGECAVTYLFGDSGIPFYKFIFTAFIVVGAVSKLEAVWMVSDIFNGLMAIPNLTGLIILRKEVKSV